MQIWLLKAVCLASCAIIYGKSNKGDNNTKVEEGPGRGFGDDINWTTWDKALPTAKALNKPVFLLIHKTWCGACQALKNEFKSSKHRDELVELAEKFVMTNTEDDEEPEDEKYAPDGAYIPRIFFLDTNGDIVEGTENSKYPRNKHYFPRLSSIIQKMKHTLKTFNKTPHDDESTKSKPKEESDGEEEKESDDEDDEDEKTKQKKSKKDAKVKKKTSKGSKSKDEMGHKHEL